MNPDEDEFIKKVISRHLRHITLASASPARKALLESCGAHIEVAVTGFDEKSIPQNLPIPQRVELLASGKMAAYLASHEPELPVITADTLVDLDGEALGKCAGEDEARETLKKLSGRTHLVHSGFAIKYGKLLRTGHDESEVEFRPISDEDIDGYIKSGEWRGAAGAYRIQGLAKRFVKEVKGDYRNVIGLPLYAICEIVSEASGETL